MVGVVRRLTAEAPRGTIIKISQRGTVVRDLPSDNHRSTRLEGMKDGGKIVSIQFRSVFFYCVWLVATSVPGIGWYMHEPG